MLLSTFRRSVAASLALLFILAVRSQAQTYWVGSWAAAQQEVEPNNSLAADDLTDATLRQVVHLSLGGSRLRVRLSNRFGAAPLHLTAVHIARSASLSTAAIETA